MAKSMRKRTILAKKEVTYGVDPTPTGSANAMLVRNLNVTPLNAETVNRDLIRAYFGNSDTLIAQANSQLDFEIELAGSGTAGTAPAWGELLEACGFSKSISAGVSVTYAPITDSIPSVTIYFNLDGVLSKITGARGTFELSVNVKQIPVIKFTFLGIYNAVTDAAAPSVSYTAFKTPKVANTSNTPTFSIHGYSAYLESLQLSLGGDTQYRTLIGYEEVTFVDRKPSGTMVVEMPAVASKDFFGIALAGTLGALSLVHGTVAGNIITLSAPKCSLQNPSIQESSGVAMLSIPFVPVPNSGNDEITLVLT